MKKQSKEPNKLSLADELGVEGLSDPVFSSRGRLFSAAGRNAPIAEITEDHLILYPPQKPFDESSFAHDIAIKANEDGILLNELGQARSIPQARFHGAKLFCMAEKSKLAGKYLVAWFDENRQPHILCWQGEALSIHAVFRLRNRTHNGELSIFPDLSSR
jgi:hypothetical protein